MDRGASRLRVNRTAVLVPDLAAQQVAGGFAATNQAELVACYEDFRGAAAGVVVRSLAHAVGAGYPDREQVTGLDSIEWPIAQEPVAGLADRANDIYSLT